MLTRIAPSHNLERSEEKCADIRIPAALQTPTYLRDVTDSPFWLAGYYRDIREQSSVLQRIVLFSTQSGVAHLGCGVAQKGGAWLR
jgi:hypothetical protein